MIHELPVGPSFNLAAIPKFGQDFRWRKLDDCWYSVVLSGHLIHIRQDGNVLMYKSHSGSNLRDLLSSYFRLCDPIDEIYDSISACDDQDDQIAKLVEEYHPGLRLLKQDPWECMVAYICSANASVDKIRKNVEAIATRFGHQLELCGDVRYTFPTCEEVIDAGLEALEELHLSLPRTPGYIMDAAKRVCWGDLDFEELAGRPYAKVVWQLMDKHSASRKPANGIGPKVADCIALFALDKMEAFPVDRHIGRALTDLYDDCPPLPKNSRGGLTDKHYRDIADWARKHFGKYACYVNQLLFHKQRPRNNSRRG